MRPVFLSRRLDKTAAGSLWEHSDPVTALAGHCQSHSDPVTAPAGRCQSHSDPVTAPAGHCQSHSDPAACTSIYIPHKTLKTRSHERVFITKLYYLNGVNSKLFSRCRRVIIFFSFSSSFFNTKTFNGSLLSTGV